MPDTKSAFGGTDGSTGDPYRVMVVDDSAVIRGLLTRSLEEDPKIKVVASVGNGEVAIKTLDRHDIEVIILDIEMPVMDGLTALPKLLEKKPGVQVIMASTLTRKNAEVSLRALQRRFQAAGSSLSECLIGARLDYVCQRLMAQETAGTSDRISTIAFDAGFNDLSYFNRQFRAEKGMTPRDFRRRFAG